MLGQPVSDAAGFYADKVRDFLGEFNNASRRVLLIIDGLDEALRGEFDATILPRVLGQTIRVLISARRQIDADSLGWLNRLGWRDGIRAKAIELDVLNRTAIAEVLLGMGAPLDIRRSYSRHASA